MTRCFRGPASILTLTLVACSGETTQPLPGVDAGPELDAGAITADAALGHDAGFTPDAAEHDAGVADAGAADDAGSTADSDAGAPAPGPDLRAWFANYNAGRGTEYLSAPSTTDLDGDARYPMAPAHVHHGDVAYGPFERNVMDFWQVDAAAPTPVLVFIHGGGFQSGSKESVHQNRVLIPRMLAEGISVASISYRYAYRDPAAALEAPIPNDEGSVHDVNGTRLDYILRDCARAIQYIRYRAAEWNVDPERIAAVGGSAGAGCSTWVGVVDDLAVPDHADPVLRESTQLRAIGHTNGQPTYDWRRWPELLQMDPQFVFENIEGEVIRLTQTTLEDLQSTPEGQALGSVLDYYGRMGPSDPPFFTANGLPDLDESQITNPSEVIHHPRAHVALYRRCEAAGLECEIETMIEDSGYRGNVYIYLADVLLR